MEQLFGMQNMLSELMDQLGDGQQTTISFELRSNPNGPNLLPRIVRMHHQVGDQQEQSVEEPQHPYKMATDLTSFETSARWQQATTMWFQNSAQERATLFENMIFKLLEPAATEEEKERKLRQAEDERKLAEEHRIAKEEEERKLAEEAAARARAEAEQREREEAEARAREEAQRAEEEAERLRMAAEALIESAHAFNTEVMGDVEATNPAAPGTEAPQTPDEVPPQETESAPVERVYTTIRGNPVDITSLGVDPEFLEALPEDMREEVLYQHIRDRRAAAPPDQPSTLDPSFLDALPPDIRAELLAEEAAERRRQERAAQRQQEGQPGSSGPLDLDPATFIASLEGPLRQAVLLDQDDDILAQLPPHIVAEATALRERVGTHRFGGLLTGQRPFVTTDLRRKPITPKRKDGIQLLEKSGLATLVRLTFLRNRPEALQDIFLELCRHRHTRIEVVSLLLSILQDGSADVAAVERSFSQLSVKAKGHDQGISPIKTKTKTDTNFISHISGENSPTLIARHCLELLNHLVKNNHSLPFYFLTEHESHQTLKRVSSRKGKGKEPIPKESKYPINNLLSLLERSAILDTKASTEEFARLLADVTKPLLTLLRKPKAEEKANESTTPRTPAPLTSADPTVPTQAPPVGDAPPPVEATLTTTEPGASTSEKKEEPAKETRTLLPPVVSEHNLELLVLILVAKEVSRETFRSTLATMHHLTAVPGALEVFGHGFAREAQRYADIAQSDLWNISKKFEAAQAAGSLKDVDLTEYTSRGADQTKLLKIFKAIDYLFNRAQKEDGEGKDNAQRGAIAIYSKLSLGALWENLSICLSYLRDDQATWPLAQPLLPMIESLLVACNHITSRSSGKRVSDPEAEQTESLFFQFTEEHRKILNYLVHMQPSLMSGSFEMLAHNPKVLEFDNKRNYFNRKLHDKKGQRIPTRAISLNIRRDMVFLDSFRSLCFRSGEEIKNARLNVRFQGEEGVDAGGLTREWYQVLARQMFDPNYALFTPVASDSATFHPNKSSYVNDEHLMFFKFVGRIIGKALYDGRLLDCHFSRAVYKHILSRPISVKDLEYYDNTYYKNLMWMLENEINDVVTETFSIEAEEYGVTHIIDLVPDGRNIAVTDDNKAEYVRLVSEYKLQTSVKDQLKEFLTGMDRLYNCLIKGFHDVIPAELISIFTEQEVELLISGLPDIDIEDWKAHTNYSNYDASSPQIQWFWRAVRAFSKEERAKLLQFATGTSKVPLNGFKALEGMQGMLSGLSC
jgi:E3 ubiquitin-protein ligase HUWE1